MDVRAVENDHFRCDDGGPAPPVALSKRIKAGQELGASVLLPPPATRRNKQQHVPGERLAGWNAGRALTEPSVPPRTIDKSTSPAKLVSTLEHLGDLTSRNLEYSYRPDVPVSYGEETITETNLLELRRRHSDVVHLRTFSKHQESKIGADCVWYIVGDKRTLKMRVQAKRVQRNGVLKIRHAVGLSGLLRRRQKNLPWRVGNGLGAVRHSVPMCGNGAAPGTGTDCGRSFVSCSSGLFVLSGQRQ